MRKLMLFVFVCLSSAFCFGQDIAGHWKGVIRVQRMELNIVLNISVDKGVYSATLDSPDQGANGIGVDSVVFDNGALRFLVDMLGVSYEGRLEGDGVIRGVFKQGGVSLDLDFSKGDEGGVVLRPQEPLPPYPYDVKEVTFFNPRHGLALAGTLTVPQGEGPFAAALLISGSGPQNRDEEVYGHKPFLVIADHLTRHGIAVLRFDDRGTAASDGDFASSSTEDFSFDAEAAFDFLKGRKEIDPARIGLIGHSEGAIIAAMIAARTEDVAFAVLLAGSGMRGDKLLLAQQELIGQSYGLSEEMIEENGRFMKRVFDIINTAATDDELKAALFTAFMESSASSPQDEDLKAQVKEKVAAMADRWTVYFVRHDPSVDISRMTCPVLALNGEKDIQAPPSINLPAIRDALAKGNNRLSTVKELPGLNHLFQDCETGALTEYGRLEQTFSPSALDLVTDWIGAHIR
ncbi:MAG: alpha/beta fold hydrolase [Tannerellaceae bacterium]|nr:alpha/beta fold hydrolase [Tannerellaceae bacterium]